MRCFEYETCRGHDHTQLNTWVKLSAAFKSFFTECFDYRACKWVLNTIQGHNILKLLWQHEVFFSASVI